MSILFAFGILTGISISTFQSGAELRIYVFLFCNGVCFCLTLAKLTIFLISFLLGSYVFAWKTTAAISQILYQSAIGNAIHLMFWGNMLDGSSHQTQRTNFSRLRNVSYSAYTRIFIFLQLEY